MSRKILFPIMVFLALTFIIMVYGDDQTFEYDSKGKRDPFVPLIGSGKSISAGIEDIVSIEDVNLEGIAIGSQGKWVAVINGQILKENEKIGSLKIKHITNRTVTLSIDGKEYNVNLPEEGGVKSEK